MALESATFFISDYKDRNYKVHAIADGDGNNLPCLWCMVYRSLGIGNNPYNYGEEEFEEDYSVDFCLYVEDCLDLDDEDEVETAIRNKFNDAFWVNTWIINAEIREDNVAKVLSDYHNLDLERMGVADALEALSEVAERMAEILEEKFG